MKKLNLIWVIVIWLFLFLLNNPDVSAIGSCGVGNSLDCNLTSAYGLNKNQTTGDGAPKDQCLLNNFTHINNNTLQLNYTNTSLQPGECKNLGCYGIGSAPAGTETISLKSGLKGWNDNAWTLSCWVKSHWIQVGDTPQEIWWSAESDAKMNLGYEFGGTGACGEKYGMMLGSGAGWTILTDTSGGCVHDVTLFNWVHVLVTHNSSGYFYYVNGTQISQSTSTATDIGAPTGFFLGRSGYGGSATQLKGMIDECYFWNRSLSRTERVDLWNSGDGLFATDCSFPVGDVTPPSFTLINLTSEGGKGYVLYNNSLEELGLLTGKARTNDTTPTFRVNTTENANCDITDNRTQTTLDCTTTGTQVHTCTEDTIQLIGLNNFSVNCSDANNNINQTDFMVNITDNIPPNSTLNKPATGLFFTSANNTIVFNFSAADNYDRNFTAQLYIDNALQITNSTYLNNTNVSYTIQVSGGGTHTWYVNFTDSFNNINQSEIRSFEVKVISLINITLNGTHQNKSYEFNNLLLDKDWGDEVNITTEPEANWSLDYDVMINWTKGIGNTTIRFNITTLNYTKFASGNTSFNMSPTIRNVTINQDNNTDLVHVGFRVEGYDISGFPVNVSIDIDRDNKTDIMITGQIKKDYVEINEFKTSIGANRKAENFTYATGGSQTININASSSLPVSNFSMFLSGYNIDEDNLFSYTEHFNNTRGSTLFNQTLSYQIDAPIGIVDDFTTDNERWNTTPSTLVTYSNGYIEVHHDNLPDGVTTTLYPQNAPDLDMRNSSYLSILLSVFNTCGPTNSIYWFFDISDGTNNQLMKQYSCSGGSAWTIGVFNYTFQRYSLTADIWNFSINGTTEGIVGWGGTLDINKRQYPQIRINPNVRPETITRLFEVQLSGAWLNRSTNNGTFKQEGNITQCFENSASNLQRMKLDAADYVPVNTSIRYFVSNDGVNFEETQKGVNHIFSTTGKRKCWRAALNSSINITSPVLKKAFIDVVKGSSSNVSVRFGVDSNTDWEYVGILNSTTSPKRVNGSINDFLTYRNTYCLNTPLCSYPVSLITKSAGMISIDSLNLTLDSTKEINITNLTKLEPITNWNWDVGFLNGVLRFYDLSVGFKGSKNITLFAHTIKNSSIIPSTANLTMNVYYSKFNVTFPKNIIAYNIFAPSRNASNLTPFGQNDITPIFNVTTYAYDKSIDIFVKFNETPNKCINSTYSNSSDKLDGFILNASFQQILTNISKEPYSKFLENQTINITMNSTEHNSTLLGNTDLIAGNITARNATAPFYLLNLGADYNVSYPKGNFTLLNSTFNMTNLFVSYNFSTSLPSKSIWNFVDLNNCTSRFYIAPVKFRAYCIDCVR